jgi:AAA domain
MSLSDDDELRRKLNLAYETASELRREAGKGAYGGAVYTDGTTSVEVVPAHGATELRVILIQSSADFIKDFVPPDYLIDGIIQRRFLYSLTGRTGSGKTALALFIAAHVGRGKPIGNIEVAQGRVLYFAGENPDDVRMRWIASAQNLDFDADTIPVDFIPGTFKISQLRARIVQEVQERGEVALVVVDTSAAYFEGDEENNNVQAGAYARQLRLLVTMPGGPCVVVLCHPVKNAEANNLVPRGGGAFVAEVDGNLTARKEGSTVELHYHEKFRGPDFAPVSFLLKTVTNERLIDSKGRNIPTVIAQYLTEEHQQALASVARSNDDKLLAEIARNPQASQAELATALGWFMKNGDPYKTMVRRGITNLEKHKLVKPDRDGFVLTDKGQQALKKQGKE